MKGRLVLIEPQGQGRRQAPGQGEPQGHAAMLVVDGRIEDFLIDPPAGDPAPRPEAVFVARPSRPMKGLGGTILDLGGDCRGFLRSKQPPAPGKPLLVQVTGWAEPGKAVPVGDRLRIKGRLAILTPGAPGLNLSRSLRDPGVRAELEAAAALAMAGAAADLGLILRTAAQFAEGSDVAREIGALRAEWNRLQAALAAGGAPACVASGIGARDEALREWVIPGTGVEDAPGTLSASGAWDELDAATGHSIALGEGFLAVEPTRAVVAVDVNTGSDLSPAAALKANLAAAREIPRQLRLRGLGGQVVIDFAPLAKADRRQVETAITAALRSDPVETSLAGWTPLGHLELLRRRSRRAWQAPSI